MYLMTAQPVRGMQPVHDVTINGSLYAWGHGVADAESAAIDISKQNPTRLVRVHGVDGIDVVSEWRNGKRV